MDKTILDNFFSTVKKGDTFYFLGDLTFDRNFFEKFLQDCHANKINLHLIRGNHDKIPYNLTSTFNIPVYDLKTVKIEDKIVVLCHYAMKVWDRSHHGSICLHGHSHGTLESQGLSYDVGIDNNNFMPVSFEKIKKIMKDKQQYFADYHGRK